MQARVRLLNSQPIRAEADYVLYWAQRNRRVEQNHALAYAVEVANRLGKPVLVYEELGCTYDQANDRLHTFVLEGVPDTEQRLKTLGIGYVFALSKRKSNSSDVVERLATNAAAVVRDDYPSVIAAEHDLRVPEKLDVAGYAVDSSCVVPMSLLTKREYAAYTIRPKIHKLLPEYLKPVEMEAVKHRFRGERSEFHTAVTREAIPGLVAECEIDHSVPPSLSFKGGYCEAERTLQEFLANRLRRYAKERNEPSLHATSDMSPYLHFGQISSVQIALAAKEYAQEHKLIADEYLEELIVRRELAFNFARHVERVDSLSNLPDWARETLRKHAKDKRDPVYTSEQIEAAETYDELWNATQKELLLRGKIHGYYRMYWGKKIIEWSPTCQDALERMIHMHDRYALDGRDPNTYTNILWLFGLHDRPWTERPIFGMVRYMSYDGMKRKTDIKAYIQEIQYLEKTGKDPQRLV